MEGWSSGKLQETASAVNCGLQKQSTQFRIQSVSDNGRWVKFLVILFHVEKQSVIVSWCGSTRATKRNCKLTLILSSLPFAHFRVWKFFNFLFTVELRVQLTKNKEEKKNKMKNKIEKTILIKKEQVRSRFILCRWFEYRCAVSIVLDSFLSYSRKRRRDQLCKSAIP